MKTTLPAEVVQGLLATLPLAEGLPGPSARAPVHSVYGGAHLFGSGTPRKLGDHALRALRTFAPTAGDLAEALDLDVPLARLVLPRLVAKLEREPVEDYRIDFEDGYGPRGDEEEDGHALGAAEAMARAMEEGGLPPSIGLRLRAMTVETGPRALRTLDLFLTTLVRRAGRLPSGFLVTLPKVEDALGPQVLADALERLEAALGLPHGRVGAELMVESPAGLDPGRLRSHVAALRGRCVAVHLGANDFLTACGVGPADQDLGHEACDFARLVLKLGVAGLPVRLVDGTTTELPIPPHRGEDLEPALREANRRAVHRAWRHHAADIRRGLHQGLYQGWDLHPAQLVSRYGTLYAWFRRDLEGLAARLRNFLARSARASTVGTSFDDAATGHALLHHFLRGLDCGALDEEEVRDLTGLSREELATRSFVEILDRRREGT